MVQWTLGGGHLTSHRVYHDQWVKIITIVCYNMSAQVKITGGGPTEYIIICVTWNTQYGGWCVAESGDIG